MIGSPWCQILWWAQERVIGIWHDFRCRWKKQRKEHLRLGPEGVFSDPGARCLADKTLTKLPNRCVLPFPHLFSGIKVVGRIK